MAVTFKTLGHRLFKSFFMCNSRRLKNNRKGCTSRTKRTYLKISDIKAFQTLRIKKIERLSSAEPRYAMLSNTLKVLSNL